MKLHFTKMQGLGNDFMVIEWPPGEALPEPARVRRWADRRLGVGFDQLLLLAPAESAASAASYRVFNADGGEVEQCGNGVRCLARYLAARSGRELRLTGARGDVEARVLDDGYVSVNLGVPDFAPSSLPFEAPREQDRYRLRVGAREVEIGAVSMGNPHAVILTDSVDEAPVGILGAELATHPAFPQGVNVGFVQVESARRIRLRVFERGVGETRACGTGAAAAVAVGRRWGALADEVEVSLPGGVLGVRWLGPGHALWQTGPAAVVYEGQIDL